MSEDNEKNLDLAVKVFVDQLTSQFMELRTFSSLPPLLRPSMPHVVRASSDSDTGNLQKVNSSDSDGDSLGLVARSVRSFLMHRYKQRQKKNLFMPTSDSEKTEKDRRSDDDVLSAFELIESPLQVITDDLLL